MNTNSKPQADETKLGRDLATFERLPKKTKEMFKLKEREETTTGPEQIAITKEIEGKKKKSLPR